MATFQNYVIEQSIKNAIAVQSRAKEISAALTPKSSQGASNQTEQPVQTEKQPPLGSAATGV